MIETISLLPGVTLRCFPDSRFKQSFLSIQFLRPLARQEAAMNALIPAVLLRGTVSAPDLRDITLRLDDLYGASVGALVRKVGDYQTTGLCCSFISDRYTLEGDGIFEAMAEFLRQLLLEPVLEEGIFRADYVDSEKKNLIATIQSQLNNKRLYAGTRLLKKMCGDDPFGVPRLGNAEDAETINAAALYRHYLTLLRESPVELFYVGEHPAEKVADLLRPIFAGLDRCYVNLPIQTAFRGSEPGDHVETMEVSQGKLAMGFVTDITIRDPEFYAMQVCNTVLGAGMTSKLFMQIREKLSLCYDISSSYHGSKGIMAVAAGIDFQKDALVREKVLEQLEACCRGDITDEELSAAKEALLTSLQGIHDSPGAIESYYATGVLSGHNDTPADYAEKVRAVTREDVAAAAKTLRLHTVYFLKGVQV